MSKLRKDAGFTILELMIATAVFSVVLLLVTTGIMQITRVYYKGLTEANAQNTAQTIIDTISQSIQFSGGAVTATPSPASPGTDYAFCVGNEQFTYRLGWQVADVEDALSAASSNQAWHALVQKSVSGADCGAEKPALTNRDIAGGRDLVGEHMRLSNLVVKPVGANMYRVTVKVVYGDSDILNSATGTDASCMGQSTGGSAFCAVSELSTIVVKRVQ